MVNAGFSRYLIEGFKRGIPPTEAMLMKKKTTLTNIKQKPIEQMSFLLNWIMFSKFLFKKNLESKVDPIKNPMNARINVMTKLVEGLLMDKSKNNANKKSTIKGLKT